MSYVIKQPFKLLFRLKYSVQYFMNEMFTRMKWEYILG